MRRISEMTETHFDGVAKPYVPPRELSISDKLTLHRDWETQIDPVTYEVIRHNLWNINEEHGATIQRISGSPVAIYALDLNPSILTEDAEFVFHELATGRDCGPPLMRRPRGGAGHRPAAVSDKILECFRVKRKRSIRELLSRRPRVPPPSPPR